MDGHPQRMSMVMDSGVAARPLRGQTALVTGASSGIGEGVARGRIIVRALGAPADGGAPERVDIRWLAQ